MTLIKYYDQENVPNNGEKKNIISFLYTHLNKYRDSKEDIEKAIDFALRKNNGLGGSILTTWDDELLIGAVVLNKTGMQGYIPENILVYIAIHNDYRGFGYGLLLMEKAISSTEGDIALHVESENSAKKLYEKLGFTNQYLEMRLKK